MGSGCNQTPGRSKCFEIISDKCVKYTGPEIEVLGICTGDFLDEVTAVLVAKILSILEAQDMSAIDLNCDFISQQMVGENKDIFTLIQVLIDSHCTLKEAVDTINDELDTAITFDLKCITQTSADVPGTIQGLINKVCSLNTDIEEIKIQLNNGTDISGTVNNLIGNYLHSFVNTCSEYGIAKSGSGSTATLTLYGQVPPYSPIPCFAPLSYFDNTGIGHADSPFCGWFICNGNNGTPDMRGYTFAGATSLPGIFAANPLDNGVDPAIQGTPYATSISDKKGTVKETLTISQTPAHNHTVNESGHTHSFTVTKPSGTSPGGLPMAAGSDAVYPQTNTLNTTSATTGISINPSGGGQAHNNIQPTVYGYWIMRQI